MKLEIDETDVESLSDAIRNLSKLRNKLLRSDPRARISNHRFMARMQRIEKEYSAIKAIWNSDIDSIYEASMVDPAPDYYVYAHCNPLEPLRVKESAQHLFAAELGLTHVPFYVGKGSGARAESLARNTAHSKVVKTIHLQGRDVLVTKLVQNVTEQQAFSAESKLIDIFGLRCMSNRGSLVNLDEGVNAGVRRSLYAKGSAWYLNAMRMKLYNSVQR